jgi:CBS domain-containing protein
MSRRDVHLDAMLRHLGAAYYDSLQDRADEADVTRAVQQVAGHLGNKPAGQVGTEADAASPHNGARHPGRRHSRVRDIMSTSVVSVDRITSYKEIASTLARHHIGGIPVLVLGRRVVGMVTDADLVAMAARTHAKSGLPQLHRGQRPHALTAEQLMTAPAITIHPDAPIASAARQMTEHRVSRLPVVDHDGTLIGIVSRRDLLTLYLRPDAEIAAQVAGLLDEVMPDGPPGITATVRDGVVTLTGHPPADFKSHFQLAIELITQLDGVIDVAHETASREHA